MLADALVRGGAFRGSRAVETASGTGLLTPLIRAVWPDVVAVDLSFGMLSRSAQPGRIQADGGPLIVSNALGDGAPFRVPAEELIEAMVSATSRPWDALQSEAHWGIWTILRLARP